MSNTCKQRLNGKRSVTLVCDIKLEKLGQYFCHFEIHSRFGITFERFISIVESGQWSEYAR